jgi:hypothetical protein
MLKLKLFFWDLGFEILGFVFDLFKLKILRFKVGFKIPSQHVGFGVKMENE